jgi:hypothetical protein
VAQVLADWLNDPKEAGVALWIRLPGERLSLRDMLLRWCDPALVKAVQLAEAPFASSQLMTLHGCDLGGSTPDRVMEEYVSPSAWSRKTQPLQIAWDVLLVDLRRRIMRNQIYLSGVPGAGKPTASPEAVPAAWAVDYRFDFVTDTMERFHQRWLAVEASLDPPGPPGSAQRARTTVAGGSGSEADAAEVGPITLRAALVRWSDPILVEAVRQAEAPFASDRLMVHGRFDLGGGASDMSAGESEDDTEDDRRKLDAAWERLHQGFRDKIERGEIHLQGVQTAPERQSHPAPLNGLWAAEFSFDFTAGRIVVGPTHPLRYVSVIASRTPFTSDDTVHQPSETAPSITPATVAALDDETILALLEEHARRVITGPDTRLIAPGKISLMPIVRGKMRHRAEQGELLPTLKAESIALEGWIASKLDLHQVPTAATIRKVLNGEYAQLKAPSKAAIHPFDS